MVKLKYDRKRKDKGGEEKSSVSSLRIYTILFFVLLACVAVIFRLYSLGVLAHEEYQTLAESQHKLKTKILPKRGEIFLQEKDGLFPVAVNRELMTCIAIPKDVENQLATAKKIAEILKIDREEIETKLAKKDDLYEVLKRKLSREEVEKIEKLNLKGIKLESESWRYYPGSTLASHIIGFLGFRDDRPLGQYGIEQQFQKKLRGQKGLLEQDRDTFGRWISIGKKSKVPARNGNDIVLNIDHVLQFKAELALKNAVERHGAEGGKIVIVQPDTGKVLAMASNPTYNLNEYGKVEDIGIFQNPIISEEYECGSVFKTFTMAAGLDTGKVDPESTYFDSGSVVEAGYEIKNSDEKSHGTQTMTEVIEKSLNTGSIHVQKLIGNQTFLRYVKDFGFGEKTKIELPGEISGNISNLKTNRDIEFFTASFGQGITVTPLQLTMAYSALANGGRMMVPRLVDHIGSDPLKNKKNKEDRQYEKELVRDVVSRETANRLALMLESNVTNGHGKTAGVPGYRIAGKTGTAQIPDKEKGGYLEEATVGTFAGFGPVDNPAFAMVVIIDYPKDVQWAESSAGPVFGEMSKFMFDYWGIEPTEEYSQEELSRFTRTHNYLMSEKEKLQAEEKKKAEDSQAAD